MNALFGTLIKGSAIAFSGNGLIYALAFVFQLMLVRFLGAENYGVWGFAYTLTLTVAQLSSMGLGFAAIYFISRQPEGGPSPAEAARGTILLSLAAAVLAALVLPAAARAWIAPVYGFPGLQGLLTVLAAAIPLIALTNAFESIFRGHQDAAAAFKMKLAPEALKLTAVPAALLLFGADTFTLAVTVSALMLAPALYGAYMLNKLFMPLRALLAPGAGAPAAAPLLRYAVPFFILEIFQVLRDRADTFIIGYLSTAFYLGVYKGAYVFASAILFIPNAVGYLLFPLLNRLIKGEARDDLSLFGERTIKLLLYLGLPAVAGAAVFSRHLMTALLGPEFLPGERALMFLSLSSGAALFHVFYGHVLASRNRLPMLLLANALALILNISLNIMLIPHYGITGAAIASLAGASALTLLIMKFSAAETGGLIFPLRVVPALVMFAAFLSFTYLNRGMGVLSSAAAYAVFCSAWALWLRLAEAKELNSALDEARSFIAAKLGGERK